MFNFPTIYVDTYDDPVTPLVVFGRLVRKDDDVITEDEDGNSETSPAISVHAVADIRLPSNYSNSCIVFKIVSPGTYGVTDHPGSGYVTWLYEEELRILKDMLLSVGQLV